MPETITNLSNNTQRQKYALPSRVLHWLMALLISVQFLTIFYVLIMGEEGLFTYPMIQTHHASGMLIFVFLLMRFVAKKKYPMPELPKKYFTVQEKNLAKLGQYLLYALMFAMPLTGYIAMDSTIYNVSFYGVSMPDVLGEGEAVMAFALKLHDIGAWIIGFAVIGHIGFVVWHRVSKKAARLLERML